jgi:pyridoxine/pyridoxamine 5'-phosphate oxidase
MNIDDLLPLHVLLWSPSQRSFHIELVSQMLEKNSRIYFDNLPVDYVTLAFANTHEEAVEISNTLRIKLSELNEKLSRKQIP